MCNGYKSFVWSQFKPKAKITISCLCKFYKLESQKGWQSQKHVTPTLNLRNNLYQILKPKPEPKPNRNKDQKWKLTRKYKQNKGGSTRVCNIPQNAKEPRQTNKAKVVWAKMTHKAKTFACLRLEPQAAWQLRVACEKCNEKREGGKQPIPNSCCCCCSWGMQLICIQRRSIVAKWNGCKARESLSTPPLTIDHFDLWSYHTRIFALAVQIVHRGKYSLALVLILNNDNDNFSGWLMWMEPSQIDEEMFL